MNPVPIDEKRVTYFGETDARNKRAKFGIRAIDRTKHVYVIGKTGMGKSTLLENMAAQDIQNGEGMAFIDPHGKTADLLLEYVPKERIKDVVYIAPFDTDYPISFNVLESVADDKKHLVVSGLMSTFKKIWVDAWSARMEYILTNTLLALLDYPGATLLGVNKMLSDKEYRKDVVNYIKDPSVKSFWVKEFANYTERMAQEAVPAIQNKVGQFTANPLIRNMIGQSQSSFNIRKCMDERKILIINLSKGKIGDENMKLLGGLLVTKIYLAAMSRADVPDRVMKMLPNFYLFVDEFQNFANASFADILSEARKYKLNLTIAHQYIEQMDEVVRAAVFGNVGTMIVFRVGATDAEVLEKEFSPEFTMEDLVNLGFTQIYLKLMIDGLTSPPFSAVTLPPIPHPDISYVKDIIDASRQQFARPREAVEQDIIKFHEDVKKPQKAKEETSSKPDNIQSKPSFTPKKQFGVQKDDSRSDEPRPQTVVDNSVVQKPFEKKTEVKIESKPEPREEQRSENREQKIEKTHKPFAVLGGLTKAKPVEQVKEPIKPVSLSNLSPQNKRPDGKIPTKDNMNALKGALANILKNNTRHESTNDTNATNKNDTNKNDVKEQNISMGAPLKEESKLKPIPKLSETKKVEEAKVVNDQSEKPKEVPEEVLKKVLDVE